MRFAKRDTTYCKVKMPMLFQKSTVIFLLIIRKQNTSTEETKVSYNGVKSIEREIPMKSMHNIPTASGNRTSCLLEPVTKRKNRTFLHGDLTILFYLGSLFGFVFEGLWSFFRQGQWVDHSALVWGPFCIVYGFGAVAAYVLAGLLHGKRITSQFLVFALSGSAVEYLTGALQEAVFGSSSWNYSGHFLNIGGHASLKMALLWGLLGILFLWTLYHPFSHLLKRLHGKYFRMVCLGLSVFMGVDMLFSAGAVLRWSARRQGKAASTAIEMTLDRRFDDSFMERIYSNMTFQ